MMWSMCPVLTWKHQWSQMFIWIFSQDIFAHFLVLLTCRMNIQCMDRFCSWFLCLRLCELSFKFSGKCRPHAGVSWMKGPRWYSSFFPSTRAVVQCDAFAQTFADYSRAYAIHQLRFQVATSCCVNVVTYHDEVLCFFCRDGRWCVKWKHDRISMCALWASWCGRELHF